VVTEVTEVTEVEEAEDAGAAPTTAAKRPLEETAVAADEPPAKRQEVRPLSSLAPKKRFIHDDANERIPHAPVLQVTGEPWVSCLLLHTRSSPRVTMDAQPRSEHHPSEFWRHNGPERGVLASLFPFPLLLAHTGCRKSSGLRFSAKGPLNSAPSRRGRCDTALRTANHPPYTRSLSPTVSLSLSLSLSHQLSHLPRWRRPRRRRRRRQR
jgi:hypothetical protein